MDNKDIPTCPFCEQLEKFKQTEAEYMELRRGQSGKATARYKSALIHELYYDSYPCGSTAYHTEKLNYCPVCGIKLKVGDADG